MKRILIVMAFMGIGSMACAQSKSVDALMEKYQDDEEFFHLDLAGSFMDFADGLDFDFGEDGMATIAKSVDRMKFFKLPVGKQIAKTDFKALQKGLRKEKYDLMMEMSEKDSQVIIYSKGDDILSDVVLMIAGDGDDDFMVIELEGEFESQALAQAMP
ncbi:DUF4252 domain-containing protein [Echinicola strongylocentroti]|uniref:DUF4252 domain-containing protein n=1 Tax=Echinicola strongylocentroti TaxID=1795355 RepID=A0A2Z4II58_9BACT|nr:DUF4252 domain-containing protein [Echinicola strongylocentroti]AWW30419.1 DUF4252 domain-containing protein [Echinicola strongylocentroti]